MAITRTIVGGPAIIQYGGTAQANTFYTESDITVDVRHETVDINTSQYGRVDRAVRNVSIEVTCTPTGIWSGGTTNFTDKVALLWPHISTTFGAKLFSATQAAEKTLIIWTLDGAKYTFQSAAVMRMPSLQLSGERILCGPMTFVCIRELATTSNYVQAWNVADTMVVESAASFTDSTFAASDILIDTYSAVWGSVTGFTSIETMDGFTVDFNVDMTPQNVDGYGTVDYWITNVTAECRFRPIGPTLSQAIAAMKIQDTGSARGMLMSQIQATNLVISGSAAGRPKLTLYSAQLTQLPGEFGVDKNRVGECVFEAAPQISGSTRTIAAIGTV